jgi:hypothetical protein
MTVTINRNVLIFVVALVLLGVVGYFIGQRASSPAATVGGPAVVTATLPVPGVAGLTDPNAVAPATVAPDTAPRIEADAFKQEFDNKQDMIIVDVRTPDAYAAGHIVGAVNIPEAEVAGRLAELPKDKHIVLYCA